MWADMHACVHESMHGARLVWASVMMGSSHRSDLFSFYAGELLWADMLMDASYFTCLLALLESCVVLFLAYYEG